jgi:hypothetical protein
MFSLVKLEERRPCKGEVVYDLISLFDGGEYAKVRVLDFKGDKVIVEEFGTDQETLSWFGTKRVREITSWYERQPERYQPEDFDMSF